MTERPVPCFHCGEPCPAPPDITVELDGEHLPVCCHGCAAVARLIFSSGLARYYQFRELGGRRAVDDLDDLADAWQSCDEREDLWGEAIPGGHRDLLLQTEGVHCAACAWLIRSRLEPQEGIERVQVDIGSGYTRIEWDPGVISLSRIALELARIGYRPHLPLAEEEERGRLQERRGAMLRLGVAGLGMMQVMMYAVGLYAGEALGISAGAERFLEWTSLLVSIPVVFYSGRPFFEAALASLRFRRVGMDVPVSLAIGVAFAASCVNFLRGTGAVYFDSVVMFIFFLTAARHVQLIQRHRNLQSGAALARLLPEWAQKITPNGLETVLAGDLAPGDRVRVRPGEPFPGDGRILSGETEVDESLLTGEAQARARGPGEAVIGGSINLGQPVELEVNAVGRDLAVSALGRMLLRARSQSTRTADRAERVAGVFVLAVLAVAALAGTWWFFQDASMTMPVVLAVLVASCPCALSLATPAALAAAGRRLLRSGVLMARGDALETLAICNVVVFDKTGTLTLGEPRIAQVYTNPERPDFTRAQVLALASALEEHSAHPVARAFRSRDPSRAVQVEVLEHRGVRAMVDDRAWRIGSADFAAGEPEQLSATGLTQVWLADPQGWVARFDIEDELRPQVRETLADLAQRGIEVTVASGDAEGAVARVANRLEIDTWHARQDPAMKIDRVRHWQAQGRVVLMVGDGVNDAPVLAAADVSMTVPGATDLANSAADLILGGESLRLVTTVLDTARATRRVIGQNLVWAITYNTLVLPLAVTGLLQPWMAALGMSLSSLLVVANSARLGRT
jgi:Cu2+-exporting ATPase